MTYTYNILSFINFVWYFFSLSIWILGAIRVFNWANNRLITLSKPIRYIIATFLAFMSFFIAIIALSVGAIVATQKLKLYKIRKTNEYTKGKHISLWSRIIIDERTRLVLAYVIIPIYSLLGYNLFGLLTETTLPHLILNICFVYVPPTVIRFVLKKQGFEYILEVLAYVLFSFFITSILYYVVYSLFYTPAILTIMAVYLIISYKSKGKWNNSTLFNYSLSIIYCIVSSFWYSIRHTTTIPEALTYSVIYGLITFPFFLYFFKKISKQPTDEINYNNKLKQFSSLNSEQKQQTHVYTEQTPRQDTNYPPHDTADTLTDIGLAHIGRITACDNPYMTPEQTAERHKAEHPFTKALAERYPDGQTRKALSRHFMLYKEFTLFLIFSMVLRNDKPLHARVQSKLKGRLSLGLPSKVIAKRNEYWRRLSEKFFESYKQKKDIAKTLDYVFWSVLPDSVKGKGFTDLAGNGSLMRIFEYTRKAIEKEYKAR